MEILNSKLDPNATVTYDGKEFSETMVRLNFEDPTDPSTNQAVLVEEAVLRKFPLLKQHIRQGHKRAPKTLPKGTVHGFTLDLECPDVALEAIDWARRGCPKIYSKDPSKSDPSTWNDRVLAWMIDDEWQSRDLRNAVIRDMHAFVEANHTVPIDNWTMIQLSQIIPKQSKFWYFLVDIIAHHANLHQNPLILRDNGVFSGALKERYTDTIPEAWTHKVSEYLS